MKCSSHFHLLYPAWHSLWWAGTAGVTKCSLAWHPSQRKISQVFPCWFASKTLSYDRGSRFARVVNAVECFLKVNEIDHERMLKINTLFNDVSLFKICSVQDRPCRNPVINQVGQRWSWPSINQVGSAVLRALLAGQCKRPFLALTVVWYHASSYNKLCFLSSATSQSCLGTTHLVLFLLPNIYSSDVLVSYCQTLV